MPLAINPYGHDTLDVDSALNDSDKTITVPAGEEWELQGIYVQLTSTATVGNRRLLLNIDDGSQLYLSILLGLTQANSLTYLYTFAPGLPDAGAIRTQGTVNTTTVALPYGLRLGAGHRIRILDAAAIDAAADDMTVVIKHLTAKIASM